MVIALATTACPLTHLFRLDTASLKFSILRGPPRRRCSIGVFPGRPCSPAMAPERPTYRLFDIDIVDLAHCRLANFAPFCSQWKHSPDQRCNEEASYFSSGVSDLVEREFVARQRLIQAGADNTRQAPQYYPLLITAPRIVIEFLLDYARLSNYLPTSAKYVVACEDISLPEGTMATRMDVAGRSLKALCESLPSSGQEVRRELLHVSPSTPTLSSTDFGTCPYKTVPC